MVPANLCDARIKEINDFLRILAPKLIESRSHIWGLKERGIFGPGTALKMLMNRVDCTKEGNKCIQ
jgi:hypothetical protein